MTLSVDSPRVYTVEGVPISVTGIAQVRLPLPKVMFSSLDGFSGGAVGCAPPKNILHPQKVFSPPKSFLTPPREIFTLPPQILVGINDSSVIEIKILN